MQLINPAYIDPQCQRQRQYVRGYQERPETHEEIALAESTVQRALAEIPREDVLEE